MFMHEVEDALGEGATWKRGGDVVFSISAPYNNEPGDALK
jgi:hypothetical protein